MTYSFYVYYKVGRQNEASVRAAAEALLQAVNLATGIQGRLLCRRDQPETWMEVYESVPDAAMFQTVLDAQVQTLQFAALLGPESRRITELFRPL